MAGTVNDGHAAQEGMITTDQSDKEENSPLDHQEQAVPCEEESCCVTHEKSESDQIPNIAQALAAAPVNTQTIGVAIELCWYCLKSLPIEEQNIPQADGEDLTLPPGGERLLYQRDPRPHFGIAHSSRSVSFPLWDSDRPREMKRGEEEEEEEEEALESVNCCPHCRLWLPRDTLRWHEEKCLLFDGQKNGLS